MGKRGVSAGRATAAAAIWGHHHQQPRPRFKPFQRYLSSQWVGKLKEKKVKGEMVKSLKHIAITWTRLWLGWYSTTASHFKYQDICAVFWHGNCFENSSFQFGQIFSFLHFNSTHQLGKNCRAREEVVFFKMEVNEANLGQLAVYLQQTLSPQAEVNLWWHAKCFL